MIKIILRVLISIRSKNFHLSYIRERCFQPIYLDQRRVSVKHHMRKRLKQNPKLRKIHNLFKRRHLGDFNRHTVAGGVAVGLFVNFLPIPFQMFWAAFFAILFSVNLPIATALTWINNPFTFIPINFFIYTMGSMILFESPTIFSFPTFHWNQPTFEAFFHEFIVWLGALGKPYLLGVAIVSVGAAVIGYCLTQAFWSLSLLFKKKLSKRKHTSK